jgi:hypothetical protein
LIIICVACRHPRLDALVLRLRTAFYSAAGVVASACDAWPVLVLPGSASKSIDSDCS